jgi:hypothetical protein
MGYRWLAFLFWSSHGCDRSQFREYSPMTFGHPYAWTHCITLEGYRNFARDAEWDAVFTEGLRVFFADEEGC